MLLLLFLIHICYTVMLWFIKLSTRSAFWWWADLQRHTEASRAVGVLNLQSRSGGVCVCVCLYRQQCRYLAGGHAVTAPALSCSCTTVKSSHMLQHFRRALIHDTDKNWFSSQAKGKHLWYSSLQQSQFVLTSWDESMHRLDFHNTQRGGWESCPPPSENTALKQKWPKEHQSHEHSYWSLLDVQTFGT